MNYSIKDLEIFVVTFDREKLLLETLESLLNQTENSFSLAVFDNGSKTDLRNYLKSKIKLNIKTKIIKNKENLPGKKVYQSIKKLMRKKLIMVFHDDDLLHPEYLSNALKIFNKYDDAVLVGTGMTFENNPLNQNWSNNAGKIEIFSSPPDFAAYLYSGFPYHFSSTIYKSDLFQKLNIDYDEYGKIADRPFLFDFAGYGRVCLQTEYFVRYRLHSIQDSRNVSTGPYKDQLFALHRKYHKLLGDNILTRNGRIFIRKNYEYLYNESLKLKNTISQKEYIREALEKGATTRLAISYGKMRLYFKKLSGYG